MPNGMYGGVRGRKTKVGRKLLRFPPTRFVWLELALSCGFGDGTAVGGTGLVGAGDGKGGESQHDCKHDKCLFHKNC